MNLSVTWIDGKRWPQHPPDPRYPDGMDVDGSAGAMMNCAIQLPYPAKRCGHYLVTCDICGQRVVVTTAGRRDDPRSVRLACNRKSPSS